ncbi:LytR C-terminal domain-containing protein [Actinokineospora sp.]|uniref:LytR C-terminal domain-containing protein n=1 Tax=Actinokineospora sp. TaxID=1872133 RepID=UPI0040384857
MTTEPTGPVRPGRIAGLALLALAAVATVIGVVTLVGGNGDSEAGQTTPPASSPAATSASPPGSSPGSSSVSPPASSSVSSPASSPTTTPAPSATETQPPTGAPGGGPSTRDQPVRVYNNSTQSGLAARVTTELTSRGWKVVETGNYSQGIIPTTTVYYRPGTGEEAAARDLATEFGMRVEERFQGIQDSSAGLIVIVTNDYKGPQGKE